MTDGPRREPTWGEVYDALPEDKKKAAFFLAFGIVDFYADGDTWFATALLPDRPAGAINEDYRHCEDLHRHAPGGRARLARFWIQRLFERHSGGPL